jgi:hypothetical protein
LVNGVVIEKDGTATLSVDDSQILTHGGLAMLTSGPVHIGASEVQGVIADDGSAVCVASYNASYSPLLITC